ncbi:MAG: metalloregulator ArsR/SmtB family transcription factor [Candidatus Hydrothermarchaeota archaeon]|jgi:ArsR family transcriptional regulator|nr:metalloregulator ArsR/SmtB family transcription factor [Candidatus Hydrothermarchaeota archaeon]
MHADICKTFANPKRLEILNYLREGEKTVGELTKLANIPQANLSQHLAMLRHRKVVSTRRKGVIIYYKITNSKIIKACDLMREVLFEQIEDSKKLAVRIASMKNE